VKDEPFHAVRKEPFHAVREEPFQAVREEPFHALKEEAFHAMKVEPFHVVKEEPFHAEKEEPFHAVKEEPFHAVSFAETVNSCEPDFEERLSYEAYHTDRSIDNCHDTWEFQIPRDCNQKHLMMKLKELKQQFQLQIKPLTYYKVYLDLNKSVQIIK
jgi:hypothetical protein